MDTTVLIVGAGPTGLMLACDLARKGVAFRIVEASPGPQPGSRGKGVQPRSLEVFDDLGIGERVLAHGRMAMPICSTAPDGQVTLGGEVPEALLLGGGGGDGGSSAGRSAGTRPTLGGQVEQVHVPVVVGGRGSCWRRGSGSSGSGGGSGLTGGGSGLLKMFGDALNRWSATGRLEEIWTTSKPTPRRYSTARSGL